MLSPFKTYTVGVLLAIICIGVFVALAYIVPVSGPAPIDPPIIQAFRSHSSPSLTEAVKTVTFFGSQKGLLAVTVLITIYLRIRKLHPLESFLPAFSVLGAWLLNEWLKAVFNRLRPDNTPLVIETGFSFPSGHAMISLALYGMLAYLIWINVKSAALKWLSIIALATFILVIGLSRIYLGVHYPSDVAAGFAAGGLWLMICIAGYQAVRRRNGAASIHYQSGLDETTGRKSHQ